MNPEIAEQIAALLNSENQLVVPYSEAKVLYSADNYLFEQNKQGEVVALIECKKVQWYQFEVCHLTVNPKFRKQGKAKLILNRAIDHAKNNNGRVVQCTIREDNKASSNLLKNNGFKNVSKFHYPNSGNNVGIWQKIICCAT